MKETEDRGRPDGAPKLVSCFWCERIHAGDHPLSVCPTCLARLSTMRSLEMSGSYALGDEAIDAAVTRSSPGNFALGYMDAGAFVVFYVGRSDSDVRQALHESVGMPSAYERFASPARAPWSTRSRAPLPVDAPSFGRVEAGESSYTRFAYSYAASAEAAFAKQCRNYDAFVGGSGLDNLARPSA